MLGLGLTHNCKFIEMALDQCDDKDVYQDVKDVQQGCFLVTNLGMFITTISDLAALDVKDDVQQACLLVTSLGLFITPISDLAALDVKDDVQQACLLVTNLGLFITPISDLAC